MASRREPDPAPRRRRGVLRHYSHPFWRDRIFWLVAIPSVVVTAAFVGMLMVFTGVPATPLDWLRPGLVGFLVLLLAFRLLGMGVTSTVGFQTGLDTGSAPRSGDLEAKGRAAGAVVGRALQATRGPTQASPAASPTPAGDVAPPGPPPARDLTAPDPADATDPATRPTAPERPTVTPDRAARVAGAMVGRRLAERRRRTDDPR